MALHLILVTVICRSLMKQKCLAPFLNNGEPEWQVKAHAYVFLHQLCARKWIVEKQDSSVRHIEVHGLRIRPVINISEYLKPLF